MAIPSQTPTWPPAWPGRPGLPSPLLPRSAVNRASKASSTRASPPPPRKSLSKSGAVSAACRLLPAPPGRAGLAKGGSQSALAHTHTRPRGREPEGQAPGGAERAERRRRGELRGAGGEGLPCQEPGRAEGGRKEGERALGSALGSRLGRPPGGPCNVGSDRSSCGGTGRPGRAGRRQRAGRSGGHAGGIATYLGRLRGGLRRLGASLLPAPRRAGSWRRRAPCAPRLPPRLPRLPCLLLRLSGGGVPFPSRRAARRSRAERLGARGWAGLAALGWAGPAGPCAPERWRRRRGLVRSGLGARLACLCHSSWGNGLGSRREGGRPGSSFAAASASLPPDALADACTLQADPGRAGPGTHRRRASPRRPGLRLAAGAHAEAGAGRRSAAGNGSRRRPGLLPRAAVRCAKPEPALALGPAPRGPAALGLTPR